MTNSPAIKKTWARVCRSWQLYLFLLLPLIWLLVFCYYPMAGLQIAFKKYNMSKGIWGSPWIGLKNFRRFFASYQFRRIIGNTLILSFYSLLASFPLPVALALGLNAMRCERYRRFIQNVVYLPHFISTIVLIGILYQMFNPRTGVYGIAYSALHGGQYAPNLVGQANTFRHFYVWSGVWQSMGWNSVIYIAALSGVDKALNVALKMAAAYPLARAQLPGRRWLMLLFSFTMLFSGGMIPTYILVRSLGMINTVWAMIIPGALSVYNMIITRTFLQTNVPGELLEASQIDGCSDARFFFSVALPLSKAVIAVITLYYAVGHWNSYFNAFLYLSEQRLYPLQIVLRDILLANTFDASLIMDEELAAAKQGLADLLKYSLMVVSSLPVIILYPFIQKYFVKGVLIGSLKG